MGDSTDTYYLGNEPEELRRQEDQAALVEQATRAVLDMAGLTRGMRVLDLGCGPGSSSLLLADLVGPDGSVVGLDKSPDAIEWGRVKGAARGHHHVEFIQADLHDPPPSRDFDAVVARHVLMHVPDAGAVVRTHVAGLRPGGLMILMDLGSTPTGGHPSTPLVTQVYTWVAQAADAMGTRRLIGRDLWRIMADAGLQPLGTIGIETLRLPSDPTGLDLILATVRAMAPWIVKTGVAAAEEIDIDTLESRLREEVIDNDVVLAAPMMIGAWARKH